MMKTLYVGSKMVKEKTINRTDQVIEALIRSAQFLVALLRKIQKDEKI